MLDGMQSLRGTSHRDPSSTEAIVRELTPLLHRLALSKIGAQQYFMRGWRWQFRSPSASVDRSTFAEGRVGFGVNLPFSSA
jgi:hypothetical protein